MNESVKTKKALRGSLFALFLCIVLLIGTTFAWFTDSVSTGVNKIQAGNLKIAVEYTLDGKTWNDLEGAKDIFSKGLWEPGHTEVVALRFKNEGNLALKYNINMNVVDEKKGVNKAGQPYKLSDYLKVKTLSQEASGIGDICIGMAFGSRSDGLAYTSDTNFNDVKVLDNDLFLEPGKVGNYLIMKVYMPETVGNEANAIDSESAASIDFGIDVVATQVSYEKDSFDNTYDKDATYPTIVKNQKSLNDAITNTASKTANVELPKDTTVTLDNGIANEGNKSRNVTITGNGDTSVVDVISNATGAEGGKLNYQRGSTFTFENLKVKAGEGSFDGIVCDELVYKNCTITGKLTLYGKATFVNCTFDNTMANQYSIWTWGGTDVKFDKCTFNTNGKAILLYGQATAEKPTNLTVNNCTFKDRNNGTAGKAAIEVGNDYNATYNLVVNKATVNGFAAGKNTGSKLWANKNSMDAKHLSVTIDGKKVQ